MADDNRDAVLNFIFPRQIARPRRAPRKNPIDDNVYTEVAFHLRFRMTKDNVKALGQVQKYPHF